MARRPKLHMAMSGHPAFPSFGDRRDLDESAVCNRHRSFPSGTVVRDPGRVTCAACVASVLGVERGSPIIGRTVKENAARGEVA